MYNLNCSNVNVYHRVIPNNNLSLLFLSTVIYFSFFGGWGGGGGRMGMGVLLLFLNAVKACSVYPISGWGITRSYK